MEKGGNPNGFPPLAFPELFVRDHAAAVVDNEEGFAALEFQFVSLVIDEDQASHQFITVPGTFDIFAALEDVCLAAAGIISLSVGIIGAIVGLLGGFGGLIIGGIVGALAGGLLAYLWSFLINYIAGNIILAVVAALIGFFIGRAIDD